MKASIRTKWLAALRSGEFEQNHEGHLRIGDRYCCLGVLCEVATPTQWETFTVEDNLPIYRHYVKCDDGSRIRSGSSLPSYTLMEAVGMDMGRGPDALNAPIEVGRDHPIWNRLRTHPSIERPSTVDGWHAAGHIELTAVNDAGIPFKDIADIIEEFIPADPDPEPAADAAATTDDK